MSRPLSVILTLALRRLSLMFELPQASRLALEAYRHGAGSHSFLSLLAMATRLRKWCPPSSAWMVYPHPLRDVVLHPNTSALPDLDRQKPHRVRKTYASQGKVVGVDFSDKVIEQARKEAEGTEVNIVSFQVASAHSIPFPDESFDIVHCHALLAHFAKRCQRGRGDAQGL